MLGLGYYESLTIYSHHISDMNLNLCRLSLAPTSQVSAPTKGCSLKLILIALVPDKPLRCQT